MRGNPLYHYKKSRAGPISLITGEFFWYCQWLHTRGGDLEYPPPPLRYFFQRPPDPYWVMLIPTVGGRGKERKVLGIYGSVYVTLITYSSHSKKLHNILHFHPFPESSVPEPHELHPRSPSDSSARQGHRRGHG